MHKLKQLTLLMALAACGCSLTACNSTSHKSAADAEHSSLQKKNRQLKKKLKESKKQNSASQKNQVNTANASSSTQVSSANSSSNSDPKLADGTDVYSLPLSDPRNPDSYKQGELMDIAGDPKYHNPDGSMNDEGQALCSSIEATFNQPQQ